MATENTFLIYQDDNGISNVNVRFESEAVAKSICIKLERKI